MSEGNSLEDYGGKRGTEAGISLLLIGSFVGLCYGLISILLTTSSDDRLYMIALLIFPTAMLFSLIGYGYMYSSRKEFGEPHYRSATKSLLLFLAGYSGSIIIEAFFVLSAMSQNGTTLSTSSGQYSEQISSLVGLDSGLLLFGIILALANYHLFFELEDENGKKVLKNALTWRIAMLVIMYVTTLIFVASISSMISQPSHNMMDIGAWATIFAFFIIIIATFGLIPNILMIYAMYLAKKNIPKMRRGAALDRLRQELDDEVDGPGDGMERDPIK